MSTIDSQQQILALLGVAQQVLIRVLDQRAQNLLEGLPGKDVADRVPPPPPVRPEVSHVSGSRGARAEDRSSPA